MQVDFNSDLGESFGLYSAGSDAEVLPYITSANIACGFHAGDAPTMGETVARRGTPGAMIDDPDVATTQILTMLHEGRVHSQQGTWVPVRADSVCIHGDQPGAAQFARAIRQALEEQGVLLQAPCTNTP